MDLYKQIEDNLPDAELILPRWGDFYSAEWYSQRYPGFPQAYYELFEEFSQHTLKDGISPIPTENDSLIE